MRLDRKENQKLKLKRRKAITIPRDGRVTWSKNSFKKKPVVWSLPPRYRITGQGRIDTNTRIALASAALVRKEKEKIFYD